MGNTGRDNHQHRRVPSTFVTPPTSLGDSAGHHGYESSVPRSYSHSPSSLPPPQPTPTHSAPVGVEFQPWVFQLFSDPDPYATAPAYAAPIGSQYMHGADGGLVYGHVAAASPSSARQHDPQTYDSRIHSVFHRPDQTFYEAYDAPHTLHELDRVRLSPFSEYDSSSSDCDAKDWDYSRSPQLNGHSGVSTTRSSPSIGGYSPDPSIGGHSRTSSGYSHLVAFTGPPRSKVRKVRRKLEPREREQVHQLRKIGACTKCWGLKMKCDDGSPCKRCDKVGAGALCVRVHFVDLDVFSKWLVGSYSRTMMHHTLRFVPNAPSRAVVLSHVNPKTLGVTMQVSAYEFIPTEAEQLEYWYRGTGGWQSMPSTPFAMKRGINTDILEKYIQDHTYYFVETAFANGGNPIMAEIFLAAFRYSRSRSKENSLLRDTLHLWTAIQLLIKGATLEDGTPLPRVLANQIDHFLERRIWQLEKQILSELQKRIFGRKRADWFTIFFTTVVFMNALERDSWRLYYWMFHMEDGYVWRHPTPPKKLIEKNDTLAESLTAHFAAISKGLTPFALDWSREQTISLLENCEDPEGVLEAIERIGRSLRSHDHTLYTNNLSHYRQDDETSLDFLYSSKIVIV